MGECPVVGSTAQSSPLHPYPENSVGYHLYQLTGLRNRALYMEHADRINLIPVARQWSAEYAYCAAQHMVRGGMLRDRLVILCGTRVRDAFALSVALWRIREVSNNAWQVVFMPHPSANHRAWSDPAVVERCRAFMRRRVFPNLPDQAFRS